MMKDQVSPSVTIISTTTVHLPNPVGSRVDLTAWDLVYLSMHPMKMGLVFHKPQLDQLPLDSIIERLKTSFACALQHFYPLAGRFVTDMQSTVYIDCNNAGADFVTAAANGLLVDDLLGITDCDLDIIDSLFPLESSLNYDGHTLPLLAVQVTELLDGIVIGCTLNHAVADAESFWHFFNSWSELTRGAETISRKPLIERRFLSSSPIHLPVSNEDMDRSPPELRRKIFRFSNRAVAAVKAKVNELAQLKIGEISSLQALTALIWRSVTRARGVVPETVTICFLVGGNRRKVEPPLPNEYLGNCMHNIVTVTTAGELLSHDLGWAACALRNGVAEHTIQSVQEFVETYAKAPFVYKWNEADPNWVLIGNSPRLDVYGSDFGWGKGLAMVSGKGSRLNGSILANPGEGGSGGIDLEVNLLPHCMASLEFDEELIDALGAK